MEWFPLTFIKRSWDQKSNKRDHRFNCLRFYGFNVFITQINSLLSRFCAFQYVCLFDLTFEKGLQLWSLLWISKCSTVVLLLGDPSDGSWFVPWTKTSLLCDHLNRRDGLNNKRAVLVLYLTNTIMAGFPFSQLQKKEPCNNFSA